MIKKISIYFFLAIISIGFGCTKKSPESPNQPQPNLTSGKIIDLSYDFSDETVYWVTAKTFEKEKVSEGKTPNGYYYSAYNYSAAEHGGTHLDSPIHFAEGRQTVDQIPLEKLIGNAVKIDVSAKAATNKDYLISVEDLTNWEKENGQIPDESIVLLQTGFGQFYPDKAKYLGTDKRGDSAVKDLHFPGLSAEAAEWLVKNRKIKAVGMTRQALISVNQPTSKAMSR